MIVHRINREIMQYHANISGAHHNSNVATMHPRYIIYSLYKNRRINKYKSVIITTSIWLRCEGWNFIHVITPQILILPNFPEPAPLLQNQHPVHFPFYLDTPASKAFELFSALEGYCKLIKRFPRFETFFTSSYKTRPTNPIL